MFWFYIILKNDGVILKNGTIDELASEMAKRINMIDTIEEKINRRQRCMDRFGEDGVIDKIRKAYMLQCNEKYQ